MSLTLGSEFVFASGSVEVPVIRSLSSNKFVVAWRDSGDSDKGKICIGTRNNTDIAYGPILTFTSDVLMTAANYDYARQSHDVAVLSENKIFVAYVLSTLFSYGIVCDIAGDVITPGAAQIYTGVSSKTNGVACAAFTNDKIFWCLDYDNTWNGQHQRARVASITGTAISLGAESVIGVGYIENLRAVDIDDTRMVTTWSYQRLASTKHLRSRIYTRSGTSLTAGGHANLFSQVAGPWEPRESEPIVLSSGTVANIATAYNFSDDLRISYTSTSGTSLIITKHDETLLTANSIYVGSLLAKNEGEFDIVYVDRGDSSFGKTVHSSITASGTLDFNSSEVWHSGSTADNHACILEHPIAVMAYRDTSNSNYGTARIVQLEASAVISITSSGIMFTRGHSTINDNSSLLTIGNDILQTSGNMFTCGVKMDNNQPGGEPLFIRGIATAQTPVASTDMFINGVEAKPVLACPVLDPTASIQIKDSLIRIYQSRIDALINQLGKNVTLEFDPIITPCPNCTFDIIRKRSTGIYIPGGPRPFQRGRKCPWCKGRGLLETLVTKCIKCLIKWNPEDAENFGISISQKKGIVRFKTFLTAADDLIRAKTAVANKDIEDQLELRVRLIQGPIPVGLRERRYCISFWELI